TNGQVSIKVINPQDLGLAKADVAALRGGELDENMTILRNVLQGKGTEAQQNAVALNAALALQVGGTVTGETFETACINGVAKAQEILNSGAAWDKLEQLVNFLKS
ncbi:MAG: anthranilate phosphoribosyltransferase, partial [Moorea sp. SIO3C2]|nr:anthranilate phosphoribosyltransferase [Moorena sp. SIO3C2]